MAAEAYGRFMGRFSEPLGTEFLAALDRAADVGPGARALDVGAGPGALTALLVDRLGADLVCAVEPSPPFVLALRERLPAVDVRQAPAEALPWGRATFDLALAQLVVHFMADPVAGMREMARVTRTGGALAACVWDHAEGRGPLGTFWHAARDLDPGVRDESGLAGSREGQLEELATAAGWLEVQPSVITVEVPMASFADWWEPFTLGVGPAGAHVAGLAPEDRERLRRRCAELLPDGAFTVSASAWNVTGAAP